MLAMLLLACGTLPVDSRLITTLDVVTITADPPQAGFLEPVVIETWVADRFSRGAEVLVWPCSPVQLGDRLRCLEGLDARGRGTRISAWAKVARVEDQHVSMTFLPSLQTQLLVNSDPALEEDGVPVAMFALACDPGVCSLFDLVRADPLPGSEAYAEVARLLADPEKLADQGPRDQAALAVKIYQYAGTDTELTEVPTIQPLARRDLPDQNLIRWRFAVVDRSPDAKADLEWDTRIRYTSGRLVSSSFDGSVLEVTWTPEVLGREGEMIIAVSDGRGGIAALSVALPAEVVSTGMQGGGVARPDAGTRDGTP